MCSSLGSSSIGSLSDRTPLAAGWPPRVPLPARLHGLLIKRTPLSSAGVGIFGAYRAHDHTVGARAAEEFYSPTPLNGTLQSQSGP
ncbi:hypothetical protein NL676_028560 [Syzygium grande]|nr:hypothetical protein NL676_028560 [Syzygium grande]